MKSADAVGAGGKGGFTSAIVPVDPGATLWAFVGTQSGYNGELLVFFTGYECQS